LDIVKNNYLILLAESEVERHEQEPHTLETTGQPSGHLPPSEEETRRRRKIEQIIEAQIEAASWLMLEGRLPPYDRNECFVRWEQQGVERMNAAFRQEENEVAAIVRLIREYIAERDRLSEWLKVAKMNEGERALVWQYGEHLEHMVTCLSDKLRLVDSQAARALVVERWATLMALLTQQSTSEPAPPPR
jgi:hypothetical protein